MTLSPGADYLISLCFDSHQVRGINEITFPLVLIATLAALAGNASRPGRVSSIFVPQSVTS